MTKCLDETDQRGQVLGWVVAEGSKAIAAAVAHRWPDAASYSCEFHVGSGETVFRLVERAACALRRFRARIPS